MSTTPHSYRPDIDGLRAIAVLLVLAVHALPHHWRNGYVGVDVFFVISGYLITAILLREFAEGRFSIRDFYVRRINRIFPALLLVLLFLLVAGPFVMYSQEFVAAQKSAWASALFVANINFFLESGYWDVASKLKPLLHLWSLGVEEQFYIVWPLLLWAVFRKKVSFFAATGGVLFVSLATNLWLTAHSQPAAFYLPMGRFWELAAGGLLAGMQRFAPQQRPGLPLAHVLSSGGLLLLVMTQLVPMHADAFPGYYVVIVVLASVLIILAGPQAWVNRYVLGNPAMVYLGKISYPLYLWHWPLLVFARLAGDGDWRTSHRNLAVAMALVLAAATYHLLERPLAQRVQRRQRLAGALLAAMAVLGLVAALVATRSLNVLAPPYANAPLQSYDRPQVRSSGKIVLLGDSNAGHLEYGLKLLYGERVVTYATPAWPYLDGVVYPEGYVPARGQNGTPAMTRMALEAIEQDPQVALVVLANTYLMYLPSDNLRSAETVPGETVAQAYEAGMRRTVQRLRAKGKRVLLFETIPTYPMLATVTACASEVRPRLRHPPEACTRPRDVVDAEREQYLQIVGRVVQGLQGVSRFDPLAVLCDTQRCYVNRDGVQFYIDSGHYTTAGSELMAAALARRIETLLAP